MIHASATVIETVKGIVSPKEVFAVFHDGSCEPIAGYIQQPGESIVETLARTAREMGAERVQFLIE